MKGKKVRNGGMGFISVLFSTFVALKITNNISWSWIWVLSPIWISVIFAIVLSAIVLIAGRIKKGKW